MAMTDWNGTDLEKIAAAEELDLASERSNGTLRDPVTMWVVRSGDRLSPGIEPTTPGPKPARSARGLVQGRPRWPAPALAQPVPALLRPRR
ncbi:DUF2255 family protein [Streptomyces sp. NPDC051366]|uniref:DUF2255 family protein n=1 Tax=Streptomyces sp. NPDC051366 TaxID=3365652 RepID=UPI0037AC7EB3